MKVKIWYMIDQYADKFDRHETECECYLSWPTPDGQSESLTGRGATFEEAKEQAIATFKRLPPSEELEIV